MPSKANFPLQNWSENFIVSKIVASNKKFITLSIHQIHFITTKHPLLLHFPNPIDNSQIWSQLFNKIGTREDTLILITRSLELKYVDIFTLKRMRFLKQKPRQMLKNPSSECILYTNKIVSFHPFICIAQIRKKLYSLPWNSQPCKSNLSSKK